MTIATENVVLLWSVKETVIVSAEAAVGAVNCNVCSTVPKLILVTKYVLTRSTFLVLSQKYYSSLH